MVEVANIYLHKNEGRLMAYIKETQKVVSYPRVIMENHLGRKLLPNEEVHHKDDNPLNNDIDNLEVLTKEEHLRLHAEENRKYFDKTMVCPVCGNEFLWTAKQQSRFHANAYKKEQKGNYNNLPFCSKSCCGKYGRKIQEEAGIIPVDIRKKLSDEQVRYIRKNYIAGDKEFGGRALARKFNVDPRTISDVITRKTYKEVV